MLYSSSVQFSSVQLLSRVWLFATPWIAARQASLSITNSQSSLRLTSIKSVMPSSHPILCRPLLLLPPISPSIRVFPISQLFAWSGQSTGVSALASFLPKKSQGWSPSEWTIALTKWTFVSKVMFRLFNMLWSVLKLWNLVFNSLNMFTSLKNYYSNNYLFAKNPSNLLFLSWCLPGMLFIF